MTCIVPDPFVLTWEKKRKSQLDELAALVDAIKSPRLVLGEFQTRQLSLSPCPLIFRVLFFTDIWESGPDGNRPTTGRPANIARWAQDSASSWGPMTIKTEGYVTMPSFKKLKDVTMKKHGLEETWMKTIDENVNLCEHFLIGPKGNRSCFNKCN